MLKINIEKTVYFFCFSPKLENTRRAEEFGSVHKSNLTTS